MVSYSGHLYLQISGFESKFLKEAGRTILTKFKKIIITAPPTTTPKVNKKTPATVCETVLALNSKHNYETYWRLSYSS